MIEGNLIGTDATGSSAIPNQIGVNIESFAFANTVGGTVAGAGNVISANPYDGVQIVQSSANQVLGNLDPRDALGTAALGNGAGVEINEGDHNTVGATTAAGRNVISGNSDGVVIWDGAMAAANQVLGNFIGTDESGTVALGNSYVGVYIFGVRFPTRSGVRSRGAGNVISCNTVNGVAVEGAGTTQNVIAGNFIGTDATGDRGACQRGRRRNRIWRDCQHRRRHDGRCWQRDLR